MAFVPYHDAKALGFGTGLPKSLSAHSAEQQAANAGHTAGATAQRHTIEGADSPRATSRPNLLRQLTGGLQALAGRIERTRQATGNGNGNGHSPFTIGNRHGGSQQQHPSTSPIPQPPTDFTRPDGFLKISSALPLLNYRYRVLRLVGEGTFSQLIVAEDTFAPSPPSQHHLAGMYGCATIPAVTIQNAGTAAAGGGQQESSTSIPKHRLVALKVMNSKYAFIGIQELDKLFVLNQKDIKSWCPIVRVQGPGAFYFQTHLVIVLELLGPALLAYMKTLPRGRVPVEQLRKIALQLVLALGYVSTAGMIHGDIKPENVLLEPKGRAVKVKLIDFGNAMTLHEAQAYYEDFEVQTLYYRAPEVILGVKFNQQIDTWSLGCLLVELATGKPMFNCTGNQQLFQYMQAVLGPCPSAPFVQGRFFKQYFGEHATTTPTGGVDDLGNENQLIRITNIAKLLHSKDPDFVSFIHGLLEYDPQKRLSSHKALLHPFLSQLFPLTVILGEHRPSLLSSLPLSLPTPSSNLLPGATGRHSSFQLASLVKAQEKKKHRELQEQMKQQRELFVVQQQQQQMMQHKAKQQQQHVAANVPQSSLSMLSPHLQSPTQPSNAAYYGNYNPSNSQQQQSQQHSHMKLQPQQLQPAHHVGYAHPSAHQQQQVRYNPQQPQQQMHHTPLQQSSLSMLGAGGGALQQSSLSMLGAPTGGQVQQSSLSMLSAGGAASGMPSYAQLPQPALNNYMQQPSVQQQQYQLPMQQQQQQQQYHYAPSSSTSPYTLTSPPTGSSSLSYATGGAENYTMEEDYNMQHQQQQHQGNWSIHQHSQHQQQPHPSHLQQHYQPYQTPAHPIGAGSKRKKSDAGLSVASPTAGGANSSQKQTKKAKRSPEASPISSLSSLGSGTKHPRGSPNDQHQGQVSGSKRRRGSISPATTATSSGGGGAAGTATGAGGRRMSIDEGKSYNAPPMRRRGSLDSTGAASGSATPNMKRRPSIEEVTVPPPSTLGARGRRQSINEDYGLPLSRPGSRSKARRGSISPGPGSAQGTPPMPTHRHGTRRASIQEDVAMAAAAQQHLGQDEDDLSTASGRPTKRQAISRGAVDETGNNEPPSSSTLNMQHDSLGPFAGARQVFLRGDTSSSALPPPISSLSALGPRSGTSSLTHSPVPAPSLPLRGPNSGAGVSSRAMIGARKRLSGDDADDDEVDATEMNDDPFAHTSSSSPPPTPPSSLQLLSARSSPHSGGASAAAAGRKLGLGLKGAVAPSLIRVGSGVGPKPLSPMARLGYHASSPIGASPLSLPSRKGPGGTAALLERHLHTESPTPSPIDFVARARLQAQAQVQHAASPSSLSVDVPIAMDFASADDTPRANVKNEFSEPISRPPSHANSRTASPARKASILPASSLAALSPLPRSPAPAKAAGLSSRAKVSSLATLPFNNQP